MKPPDDVAGVERRDGWAIVRPRGDIDSVNAVRMIRDPITAVENSDAGLIVDLSDVTYIDSAGMRALLGVRSALSERRQRLALVMPEGSLLRRAMEIGGVLALLPPHATEGEARRSAAG